MRIANRQSLCLLLVLAAGILFSGARVAAAGQDLEAWVRGDLADYVTRQLASLPRFNDVSVRFVVFRDGQPAVDSDALSIALRDSLQRRVAGAEGIRIAWQPDPELSGISLPDSGSDCEASEAEILVGLEVQASGRRNARVTVRALDVVEQSFVPGFSQRWEGSLDAGQRRAFARPMADRSFLGDRSVPYAITETDLMARHLAHALRCELMRQVFGEYRVSRSAGDVARAPVDSIPALVQSQLTGIAALRFVVSEDEANARLEARLHAVDGSLHQYWITLAPSGADAGLQPVTASVYLDTVGDGDATLTDRGPTLPAPGRDILDPLRLVRIDGRARCSSGGDLASAASWQPGSNRCTALRIPTRQDAVVFVLNHQLNRGLVHLSGSACTGRPAARVSRARESALVTLPGSHRADTWVEEETWRTTPDSDTYYAIAVSDSRLAHAVGAHVARLPQRCSESVRPGLRGSRLEAWLGELERLIEGNDPHVDWRALRVREIY